MRLRLLIAVTLVALLLMSAASCGSEGEPGGSGDSSLSGKIDTSRMMDTISYMASEELQGRATGSPESSVLETYLADQFAELGLQPVEQLGLTGYREEFPVPSERLFLENPPPAETVTGANIMGEIAGDPGSEMLILTANYDGLGVDAKTGSIYPGADYNASGCSGVLELARVFTSLQRRPRKNLVFALLGAEECGNYGSRALAEAIESAGLRQEVRIINLEGIGAGAGSYMDVWDLNYRKNKPTVEALEKAAEQLGVALELGGAGRGSSAATFFLFHQAAVTCDWSWYERSEHPDFHSPDDLPERINQEGLMGVTAVVADATWTLAYE